MGDGKANQEDNDKTFSITGVQTVILRYFSNTLHQQSPTFLTSGTGFVEDNFSMDGGGEIEQW